MTATVQTIVLPCGDDAQRHDPNEARPFTGFRVGPLFCHHAISDDESLLLAGQGEADYGDWGITHLPSGASIQRAIPSHFRAIWLARQLLAIPGMDGDSAPQVRAAVADQMAAINVLRVDAVSGDCQGACVSGFGLYQGDDLPVTDPDFFAAMAVGIPPITPPGAIPMTQLKAFYVDDMPTIYAAATPEEAARLYEEDVGDPCDEGYPREVSAAELDRSIPEFGEDEQPTGEMTTMRTWLEEASPGFLCGAE